MKCGKTQTVEDETPLTCSTSNITEETRARFNSLLLSALGQETQKRQKNKDEKSEGQNGQGKQKAASIRRKQRNGESKSGSETEVTGTADKVILNKKLKNEENESKVSHVKNIEVEVKSGSSSSVQEEASGKARQTSEQRKPVPLPRQKSVIRSSPPADRAHLNNEVLPKMETKKKKHKNKEEIELEQFKSNGSPSARQKKSSTRKQRAKEAVVTQCNDDNKIVGVHVHKSDFLEVDPLITHPIVKVYLLDGTTGNYLKKSVPQRPASFFHESEHLDYVQPLMTDAFDYRARKSLTPEWEELVVFNENLEHILRDDLNILILFEILDFVNFEVASSQYRKLGAEGGWHRIAWAFLKPVGANGVLNMGKQVRLQLYKPWNIHRNNNCGECDVYQWWISGKWERYPATLYVTVQGMFPPEQLSPVLRSRSVLQQELSEELQLDDNKHEESLPSMENKMPLWSRLPLQSCQIPNKVRVVLPTASRGCLRLQFSNNGYLLACATVGEETFHIAVYTIPEGKLFTMLRGHLGLVYDVSWSTDDSRLISASADCTACLWDVPASQVIQMLPHPSFVYSVVFHPGNSCVLVTGCCDHVVRVWSKPRKSLHYEAPPLGVCRLLVNRSVVTPTGSVEILMHDSSDCVIYSDPITQELEAHTGFVNALTINILTNAMYTGDSKGAIIEWITTKVKPKRTHMHWKLNRKFDVREIEDTVVNKLVLHPQGKRLLIHARDCRLRMLDIVTGTVIQCYSGALNHRFQTQACISPCGGLVISGSEDGAVYVWQTDTGEQLAVYTGLQLQLAANAVHYHPHDHMAVFGSYGSPAHVIVCAYDSKISGKEIGLQIMSQKQTLKLSVTQTDNVSVDSNFAVEEAAAVSASNVKMTSILEKMDRILKHSSSTLKKASESL